MKQYQFRYESPDALRLQLEKIKAWRAEHDVSRLIFHIFTESSDVVFIQSVCSIIANEIPDALYLGATSAGDIYQGDEVGGTVIGCLVMELPSSRAELTQLPLNSNNSVEIAHIILDMVRARPWVKNVELLLSIRALLSSTDFCRILSDLPEGVQVCGGCASTPAISLEDAYVFSSAGEFSANSIVVLLEGGEDLHFYTIYSTGWRALGRHFTVTHAKYGRLYELDHHPAFDIYHKYLNVPNENIFFNTLEFPLVYTENGVEVVRALTNSYPDGSFLLSSDIVEGTQVQISYGDPRTMLTDSYKVYEDVYAFAPQAIVIFNCAARKSFWGENEAGKETIPLEDIAPSVGLYTSGEMLRSNGQLFHHNHTLVLCAMREGEGTPTGVPPSEPEEVQEGRISYVERLAIFIHEITGDLEQANRALERVAVTDGLTQLYNRMEIERRIRAQRQSCIDPELCLSLIMLDIDNFKQVNDIYGHKAGDDVIVGLSSLMKEEAERHGRHVAVGRWGGEEFMMLVPYPVEIAHEIAENVRRRFSEMVFTGVGSRTVSVGVTAWDRETEESSDALCKRADDALYEAKRNGKNQVVVI